ncbi:diguanylate cyclase [Arcobacter aquimarinus]|uniref:diguanylate cyclase n=1 Tax=Arcobacter aquimarinus TaxID=1315211 RepID=UPI003BB1528D
MKSKNFLIYFTVTIIFCFTLFILKYISDTKNDYQKFSEKILFEQASTLHNSLMTLKHWNSQKGSIYIKAYEEIDANQFIKDGIVHTNDKELLIKMNPAWMIRELSEVSNLKQNYYFKITSLSPLNPINKPDKFEKRALEQLNSNKEENFYTSLEEDKYNFLGALKVQPSCLSCHNTQNYKVGDIIGGLRVSVPIENYKENIKIIESKSNLLNIVTIFTSIVFMGIITYTITSIYARELNILKLNKTLELKVNQRTKDLTKANKKLLENSITDYLTNLSNRRHFFEVGLKTFHLAKRENIPLSIICVDIDFFKNINDTYGHNIGDEILKFISRIMEKSIRKSDTLARTGGEEFSILLYNTNENQAFILAEKIRQNIEKASFKDENLEVKVTISLGISQLSKDDKDLDSIIKRADKALYMAKEKNRNTTIIYS